MATSFSKGPVDWPGTIPQSAASFPVAKCSKTEDEDEWEYEYSTTETEVRFLFFCVQFLAPADTILVNRHTM